MDDRWARVRGVYAEWARGDFSSSDWAHPEIELVIADGPAPGSWRGHEGMREGWRDMLSMWDDFRAVAEGFRELDDGRMLVLMRNTGRAKSSGLELADVQTRGANVVALRDGKVGRLVAYFSRDRALADLGIAE